MQTEIEKRIKVHVKSRYSEEFFRNAEGYQIVFYESAKFILELPELREAVEILKFYGDEDNWMNPDAHVPYWTLWSDGAVVIYKTGVENSFRLNMYKNDQSLPSPAIKQ